ncbi:YfiR family protein [Methylibium rhizosphaerae]|jgi:hypothetical protein|uniref:YfiR family protein n=1 Tax=Methylibium rhizosphaerae TaxID=2570323 RepID=UPI0015E30BA8|nr:YfiR family protein [Methylibium rhizosphaerae]
MTRSSSPSLSARLPQLRRLGAAWLIAVTAAAGSAPGPARAQDNPRSEPQLKAQIVFRALLFVQWPRTAAADGPLRFCVFDESPLALALRDFDGRRVNDRMLQWRRVGVEQLATCQVAYAGGASGLAALARNDVQGIFWVGDELGLLERGVMLNLQVDGGRVVFDVGLGALRRQGLDISAKVLRLARYVKES